MTNILKERLQRQDSEKTLSFSWILMWSLAYIACFVVKPDLFYGLNGYWFLLISPIFGLIMFTALLLNLKPVLFVCGVAEVLGGVASWTGAIRWNVFWTVGYDPVAQISMAFLDLISAVLLFYYSSESIELHFW